ncbi:HECT-like ubiquitin-conjugating enzyme-binding-domain-containing protein, partial [Gilbertella persicaria]|uniref:HECT-like ubiquitin-conjugating enzyme-binding-domain-containing protein n=1 Tax=Gilbertella persicaria TaxID=101096 RepID=UPI00221EF9A7
MIPFYAEELSNINVLRATILVDASCDVAQTLQIKDNVLTLKDTIVADLSLVNTFISTQNLVIAQPNDAFTDSNGLVPWEIKLSLLKSPSLLRSQQNEVKEWWSSKDVTPKQLHCQHCAASLIDNAITYQAKDLPSEHWYELVECWICHETKPEEHKSRMRPILARSNVILVGTTYFLLHPNNIATNAIEVNKAVADRQDWDKGTLTKWIAINCSKCHHAIGEGQYCQENQLLQLLAVKLFKYSVTPIPTPVEQPVFTDFFISDLVNAAKIHATHKFLIQGRQNEQIYSLIWLFNWDTNIIFNHDKETLQRQRVIKVMYLSCKEPTEQARKYIQLWSKDKSTDHLIYPDDVCHQLVNTLHQSTLILPPFMQTINHPAMIFYQGFSIGFLRRSD